ncbi:MAG: histidine phosphatase family protein [Patescibacteria group bacterium]
MEVYFVRHGETAANRAHVHQLGDTPLNERGQKQAQAVGLRLKNLQPTRIIASPLARAYQTGKIIGEELNLPVTTHDSLVELKRPNYIMGYKHYGLKSLWYMASWFVRHNDPAWRETGGESYEMFLARIQEAREYLETFQGHERIVVVSHSIFINFFVEHVCSKRRMSIVEAFLRFAKIILLDNTSITHLQFQPSEHDNLCNWHVVKFDDDTHVVA